MNPTSYSAYQPLQDADPRVTVVPLSGHQWATYSDIDSEGLLRDVEATPWDASSKF